jgi:hypothetical protein
MSIDIKQYKPQSKVGKANRKPADAIGDEAEKPTWLNREISLF